jgi:vacuolar-type H+-ATPase subunit F/Vma7
MSTAAAIGETAVLHGFALAGVVVTVTASDREVLDAWQRLGDVALVVLSPSARRALGDLVAERPDVLTVVTP